MDPGEGVGMDLNQVGLKAQKRQQNKLLHRSRWKTSETSESCSPYFNSRSLWSQCICMICSGYWGCEISLIINKNRNLPCATKKKPCMRWFSFRLATVTPPGSQIPPPTYTHTHTPPRPAHSDLSPTKINCECVHTYRQHRSWNK